MKIAYSLELDGIPCFQWVRDIYCGPFLEVKPHLYYLGICLMRLIRFFIILKIICPKSGAKSNVSKFESFLLWVMEHCHHTNLGYLII